MMRLVLISGTESTRIMLLQQLKELLPEDIHIASFSIELGIKEKFNNSIVLFTTRNVYNQAAGFIDDTCKAIVARRTLNFSYLDKLYSIQDNSKILLVNDTYGSALEVIELFKQTGFSNFLYTPYYPNCDLKSLDFDYVLTPGELALCPHDIAPIINIGGRILDITSIVELLHALGLLDERAHLVSAKYIKQIISQGWELHNQTQDIRNINEFLFKVIDSVDDGLLSYDNQGLVNLINTNASKVLNIQSGKQLKTSLLIPHEVQNFFLNETIVNQIFSISHAEYLFNKWYIDSTKSYICTIKNVRERINIENRLRKELKKQGYFAKHSFESIIHKSPEIKTTLEKSKKLAASDYNILILGESGTGKELFASAIHNYSQRSCGPYLAVNFSALPEELIESELFGYEEGAFTGAKKGGKIGLFELANGGTIFLDEIGDIPPKIQLSLLRVLQEKEILKVGGNTIIPVDVRVIAATNKDLLNQVEKSLFREDLYYRLKKLYINLPPLRERKEDIIPLFQHFIQVKSRNSYKISPEVEKILQNYGWPGNVRELENTSEYILAICDEDMIMPYHLPDDICESKTINLQLDEQENFLLQVIYDHNQRRITIGRKKLSELSFTEGLNLSEQQVRTRIDKLAAKGYIRKIRGNRGLELTNKGEELTKISLLQDTNTNGCSCIISPLKL
ncbi:sigma 54-interacting transcriptional regulator [Desulfosporosinus sp. PR]|uniref:sigma 54-interacting transcriptional regulator n=1 Tax=Candidatus Desulfosporosinus nitrosoreducens TaxID=3401928 RepID=UPI0027FF1797|nr:sigma 54-interacting transcriptional regulator [Desulfosporosinus sp. PR]MDQ7092643.1 sigma 54-interacting transcriptional regulator [Desulfosporosinus sp. PR]